MITFVSSTTLADGTVQYLFAATSSAVLTWHCTLYKSFLWWTWCAEWSMHITPFIH